MKKFFALTALALLASAASAQTAPAPSATATTGATAGSMAETGPIGNIGNPTIIQNASPQLPQTTQIIRQHGLPVASAGPTYVSGASDGTCMGPGKGAAIQTGPVGVNLNGGADLRIECDGRADAVNIRVTGGSLLQAQMRQCQNPNQAQAFEDAADREQQVFMEDVALAETPAAALAIKKAYKPAFRCPDRLRPKQDGSAPEQQARRTPNGSADPFIASSGRQYPSPR